MARAHWFLLAGASAGLILAGAGVLHRPGSKLAAEPGTVSAGDLERLPDDAVAAVNGRLISRDDFQQALMLEVAAGARAGAATREKVRERMIDEELRVQRALELGLQWKGSRVRMDLASAVAEAATAQVEMEGADDAKLRASYAERKDHFDARGPLRVRHVWAGIVAGNAGEAFNRARTAASMLRDKTDVQIVREITGTAEERPVPDTFLTPAELERLLDRPVLNEVLAMAVGETSDPIRVADGFHVFQILERRPHASPGFEASRLDVAAEFWSGRFRRALEEFSAGLRRSAVIQRADGP